MSWFLAFAGFAVLVILHELGHFTAAKAVGMRVEKFSLFFPPTLLSKKVGETEYAIGSIPAGGYVKISGMNPSEDLPEEVRDRAYHAQPVWKRIVVIAAGPAVNLVVAFLLLLVFYFAVGPLRRSAWPRWRRTIPAAGVLHVERQDRRRRRQEGRRRTSSTDADLCPPLRPAPADGGLQGGDTGAADGRDATASGGRSRSRPSTTRRPSAPGSASSTAPPTSARTSRSASALDLDRRPLLVLHEGDARAARAADRPRAAQGDLRRGGRLRGHSPDDPQRVRRRDRHPRADLAVAGDREPVPVPAARRRAHLLGDRREGAGASRCRSR